MSTGPLNLFKYMSASTAHIVLSTGRLRWSRPGLLNHAFDVGFDLHLDVDPARVRAGVFDLLWADYLDAAHVSPAPRFDLRKVATGPGLDRGSFDRSLGPGVDASLDQAEALAKMQSDMRAQLARAMLRLDPLRRLKKGRQ